MATPAPRDWTHEEKAVLINKALALPVRTYEAVSAAVGPDFVAAFPYIMKMLTDPQADLEILKRFMSLSGAIASGDVDKENATTAVGQWGYDTYIKPVLR